MDEITLQSIVSLLDKHAKILVALPTSPTIDHVAAALAFQAGLTALGKTVVLAGNGPVPTRLGFLSATANIRPLEATPSRLLISVNTAKAELAELSYDTQPGKISIYLRSKAGQFLPADVSVAPAEQLFDVVLMVGVESPEQLGQNFTSNAELFYALPRINIDTSPHNENHGTLNLVNLTSSSVSELSYHVLTALKESQTVPPAASSLLAGILSSTDSLRNQRTTPDTFAIVADLIAAGAEYALVVKHLFKTERLGFLKLWGRSLARLKVLGDRAAGYSVLLPADFDKTGEDPLAARDLLAQLQENITDILTLVLVVPEVSGSRVLAVRNPQLQAEVFVAGLESASLEPARLENGLEIISFFSPISTNAIEPVLVTALTKALPAVAV